MERYGGWDEPEWRRGAWDEGGRRTWREPWRGERDDVRRGERWEYEGERYGRAEIDPPWVERGPWARGRQDTRGLVEWEDRGPLEWLGERARARKRREAAEGRGEGARARGPKGYHRSDEAICDEVCERIARSGIDADEVAVKVEGREVTLEGTVSSRLDKWRLEDIADDVFGVEDVHDRLRVRRAGEAERSATGAPRH